MRLIHKRKSFGSSIASVVARRGTAQRALDRTLPVPKQDRAGPCYVR